MVSDDPQSNVWVELAQCYGDQPVMLAGVNLWTQRWVPAPTQFAKVRGAPFGPVHEFQIYHVLLADRVLVFAAGEFANNFWGFFVPPGS
jgi:hypothetical protein